MISVIGAKNNFLKSSNIQIKSAKFDLIYSRLGEPKKKKKKPMLSKYSVPIYRRHGRKKPKKITQKHNELGQDVSR